MGILESILLAVSLCADCFAVTLCSSVTLKSLRWTNVLKVALPFAVIQTGLLLAGWAFGSLFASYVIKVSHIIGFLLLLYVGGSMLIEGIRGHEEVRDLGTWGKIFFGGLATSIDALAVGAALSIEETSLNGILPLLAAVFIVTALSAVLGICGGRFIGRIAGRVAEIVGGIILIGIGVSLLL